MTQEELEERLRSISPYPISVKVHDNRSTYVSARRRDGIVHLSVHRMFLHAPAPVLESLICFGRRPDRKSRAVIRQMAYLFFTKIEPPRPDKTGLPPQGDHIDLQEIFDRLNKAFFEGKIPTPITWFQARYRRFRRMTYGLFDRTLGVIRINRLLDSAEVPLAFIEFIVYHEMLHFVCPAEIDSAGRLRVHTAAFRQRERLHPEYDNAKEWEKKSLKYFKETRHVRT